MGQKEKLINRLKSKPKDFTFDEAESLLGYFRRRLKNRECAQEREIFAIDKEFFRRNTPVFQGKIL